MNADQNLEQAYAALIQQIAEPASVSIDGRTVTNRSLREVLEALEHLRALQPLDKRISIITVERNALHD